MLSQDTPAEVYFIILYFDLQLRRQCIMFHYWCSQNSTFHKKNESISLLYVVTYVFAADKYSSPTPGQQVSVILWNITIPVWCLCDIIQFVINTVIIVTSFVWGHHHVFVIAIIMGECAILILQTLRFGVCHRY